MHPTNYSSASASSSKVESLRGSKTEEEEVVDESLRKPVLDEKEKAKGIETELVAFRRRPPDFIYAKKSNDPAPQIFLANARATQNRWDRKKFRVHARNSPEMVERKVRSLLNKLTMEKFDSLSDQIIQWANKSENEKDGRTLIQVIKLVFAMATD